MTTVTATATATGSRPSPSFRPPRTSPRTVVYLGPSLATADAAALLPDAEFHPPVRHGDLLRLDVGPGDRVLVVDGLFMHSAPVRHREILHLLAMGVTVAGCSSMGALRAAELAPYGMRGTGDVYALYRDGEVDGDDEVAVVHGPAETGHRPLSEPLVNVRLAVRDAVAAGVLTVEQGATVVELVAALPFRTRGYRTLAADHGHLPWVAAFLAWQRATGHDAKRADAVELLRMAAADDPALAPAGPGDQPVHDVTTTYFHSWLCRQQGTQVRGQWVTDNAVAAAVRLLHPEAPALHRRAVLTDLLADEWSDAWRHGGPRERTTGTAPDVGAGPAPDADLPADDAGPGQPSAAAELVARAVAAAEERGLTGPADDGPQWSRLTPAERTLPATEAVALVLVRGLGAERHDRVSCRALPPALTTGPVLAIARAVVAAAATTADGLPTVDAVRGRRARFSAAAIDRCYARLWGLPHPDRPDPAELTAAVRDRGFADLEAFRILAEPFVAHLRIVGPPQFPGQGIEGASP